MLRSGRRRLVALHRLRPPIVYLDRIEVGHQCLAQLHLKGLGVADAEDLVHRGRQRAQVLPQGIGVGGTVYADGIAALVPPTTLISSA